MTIQASVGIVCLVSYGLFIKYDLLPFFYVDHKQRCYIFNGYI